MLHSSDTIGNIREINKTMTSYQAVVIPTAILEMLQWVNIPQNLF